jgi:hypothetical protein
VGVICALISGRETVRMDWDDIVEDWTVRTTCASAGCFDYPHHAVVGAIVCDLCPAKWGCFHWEEQSVALLE